MNAFKTHFDAYVVDGDSIKCEVSGITFTARLEFDQDSHVDDYECYSKSQIAAWERDEWCFFGVVLAAEQDGVSLGDHLASVWAIEGNFPSRRKNPNKCFRDVANELLPDALAAALKERTRIISVLTQEQPL